jgi:hypothetical protein
LILDYRIIVKKTDVLPGSFSEAGFFSIALVVAMVEYVEHGRVGLCDGMDHIGRGVGGVVVNYDYLMGG